MLDLKLDKAKKQTVNGHQYYVFPKPPTRTNQRDRPTKYADEKALKVYTGKGNNGSARLHPDAFGPTELFMTALLEYGEKIDDWSMKSAKVQSGYRPDDASQGANYLRIIKNTIKKYKAFDGLTFPADLEAAALGVLGVRYDPRRVAFRAKVGQAAGWTPQLAKQLFDYVDNAYAPRGSNPHATGFVFDLEFTILAGGKKTPLGADTSRNEDALRSAAGTWINTYAPLFCFDSYDTGIEIWHLEYRGPCGCPTT